MAALAQASEVVEHVRAIREHVVHLIGWGSAEQARVPVPPKNPLADLSPVLRELLLTSGLFLPSHYQIADRLLDGFEQNSMQGWSWAASSATVGFFPLGRGRAALRALRFSLRTQMLHFPLPL